MDTITATPFLSGEVDWTIWLHREDSPDEGFRVKFSLSGERKEREAARTIVSILEREEIDWLAQRGTEWILDSEKFRHWLKKDTEESVYGQMLQNLSWLTGAVRVTPEVDYDVRRNGKIDTKVHFNIFKSEYLVTAKTKIFLSHKGADKPMVERFSETLRLLGFDPWLDKDNMPGGTELHRGIRQGFKDSCAVVFFITPNFRDESYLRNEINYAVEEKTEKADRFSIITLVFQENGKEGMVPEILRSYVWKHPSDELEALREIIRGLPISVGLVGWRDGV